MKIKDYIIIALFIIILFLSFRSNPPEIIHTTKTDTVTQITIDTVKLTDTTYIPIVRWRVKVNHKIDTVFVLQEYFTKNYYQDTISDSKALIVISDTIYKNKIVSRSVQRTVYPITIYRTIKVKQPLRSAFYLGVGLGGGLNQFGVTGSVGLQTKNKRLYTVNYDVINKTVYGSVYFKIF